MAEEMNDVQNKDDVEEVDVHLPADGEEKIDGYVSGNPGSEDEQVDMSNKGHWDSSSPVADFEYENLEARYGESHPVPNEFNHDNDGGMRMDLDQEKTRSPSNDNENQGEMDELHKSSFEFKERNFHLERGTEDDSAHSQEASPPTANNDNQVGKTKNTFSEKPYESPKSPNGNRVPYSEEGVEDRSRSPTSHSRNHSSVPKNNDLSERISPTRTSVSPQRSRHKDGSRKRMARSPEPRYSPKRHRRHERSVSRSPVPRRDHRRDYRDRSRSRSPYIGDRHRSPRRRYSPRRRSPPGHHSRRHYSPRRRPWSPPPNRRTGLGKPGKNLFVAGFSFLTTERDLERKFSRFGRVRDVRIVRDKRSGDSRGFGFLSMDRDEDADAAIRALDETEWNGRIILVEKSKSTR